MGKKFMYDTDMNKLYDIFSPIGHNHDNRYYTESEIDNRLSAFTVSKEITQAEYNALSESEKNNGTIYYIKDSDDIANAGVISYDNTNSGLKALSVQSAIDEVNSNLLTKVKSNWHNATSITTGATTGSCTFDLSVISSYTHTCIGIIALGVNASATVMIPFVFGKANNAYGYYFKTFYDIDGVTVSYSNKTITVNKTTNGLWEASLRMFSTDV